MPRLKLREEHVRPDCKSILRYAALSYCWGSGENQAKTIVATLASRKAGIAESELPPVIREAIQVTRALEIPYLWIDALCIVQDDPSDWERQCAEMHKVYGTAYVTLCAANSRSCDEGFLRQSGRIIRIPFQSHLSPDIKGSFLVQHKGVANSCFTSALRSDFLSLDTSSSRWGSRGWVFQEAILSTRRLIFGARDLHFLCSESHQRRGQDAKPYPYDHNIGKSEIEEDIRVLHRIWDITLHNYSLCEASSFTHATDILPALSGLAQLLHSRLKDDYYAGHWGRNLYKSLLWFEGLAHTHHRPFWSASSSKPRPEAFIAPSWSNLNKGFTYFLPFYTRNLGREWCDCRSEINVLKSQVLVSGTNPFGALKGCTLRLRGYTLDLSRKEVHVAAGSWLDDELRESNSLMVCGRDYGTLNFDCTPNLHDKEGKCVSEGGFGHFKLLLLMRCDYRVHEVPPTSSASEGEFGRKGERDQGEYGKIKYSGEAIPAQQQKGRGVFDNRGDNGRQEQMSGRGLSAGSDHSSDNFQSKQNSVQGSPGRTIFKTGDTVRKGFGLILCPTGNDGEFYRVGVFTPVSTPGVDSIGAPRSLGGDIRELQHLAQVETIQLV